MRASALTALCLLAWPSQAAAELALLTHGSCLSITARRVEGETIFMTLREGGEVGVPVSLVSRFLPDEIVELAAPSSRALSLREQATAAARRHGLDPALVLAVVGVESDFQVDAVSPKGARGLMQLMPEVAAALGVRDPFEPLQNLDGGTRHLGQLLTRFGGDVKLALAAYNAGSGAVERYGGIPPYRETRAYVEKVLRRYGGRR